MRWFSLFVLLLLFWAALSFQPANPFLVGSGIAAAALVALAVIRHELVISDWSPVHWFLGSQRADIQFARKQQLACRGGGVSGCQQRLP